MSFKSRVASTNLSISSNSRFGVTRAYIWVVFMLECPSILLMVSIGTPSSSVTREAKECLEVCTI